MAYADFVTAMMAFFLVMWIVGLSDNAVKQAVAGYFKDPTGFMKAVESGNAPFKVSDKSGGPQKSVPSKGSGEERKRLEQAKKQIEEMVAKTPEFKELSKYINIKTVNEGLRIDLLEAKESLFFDSGSAKVKPGTVRLLSQISAQLEKLPNNVIVEGHTDSRPLNRSDGYTNWELSADRANSARKVVETAGLEASKVAQVRGYAATQPRDPDHPESFANRRISIIVMMSDAMRLQQLGQGSDGKSDIGHDLPVTQSPASISGGR